MADNKQVIETFYTAFQNKDYKTMQACYADGAVFSDEVFMDLNANEARAMWEMLIKRGKDLVIEFENINADTKSGNVEWIATYTFSASGNKVVNRIKAVFEFENAKIIKHTDSFDFPAWAKQALGFKGRLLGRTNFLRNKIRATAKLNLEKFISENKNRIEFKSHC